MKKFYVQGIYRLVDNGIELTISREIEANSIQEAIDGYNILNKELLGAKESKALKVFEITYEQVYEVVGKHF